MERKLFGIVSAGLISLGAVTSAHASLSPRAGGQAFYDTDRDIVWIADANLADTETFGVSGINTDGSMTWDKANEWIAAMNTQGYLGYNNWKLPSALNSDGSGPCDTNTTICNDSDMGHLYHVEFALTSGQDVNSGNGNTTSIGLFQNIKSGLYWYREQFSGTDAWIFDFTLGGQYADAKNLNNRYAWAVADGDPNLIPIPAAAWLFVSALAGTGVFGRRRRKS